MTENNEPKPEPTSHAEPDDLQYVVHHAAIPETKVSRAIDGLIRRIGDFASWFWVLLMLVICLNVFMKNVLAQGSVQLEEVQWHIYSAIFLLGLSYTMVFDNHVRVDVIHDNLKLRTQAWIEFFGILLFLVPFIGMLLYFTFPFVTKAFVDGERSSSPAGLSHYWIIKSALLIGLLLLMLSSLSRLHRCIKLLFGGEPTGTSSEG